MARQRKWSEERTIGGKRSDMSAQSQETFLLRSILTPLTLNHPLIFSCVFSMC